MSGVPDHVSLSTKQGGSVLTNAQAVSWLKDRASTSVTVAQTDAGTQSVMLQVVTVGSALIAERYTYIPYTGLFYIAGQWVANNMEGKKRPLILGAATLLVVIFSAATWKT